MELFEQVGLVVSTASLWLSIKLVQSEPGKEAEVYPKVMEIIFVS